ncbi:MAG: hypothetical protein K8W52_14710 [Deltaproteobacteria bacterium]|nr:hypothetical protein [Deltaproteobacteria bacterium]
MKKPTKRLGHSFETIRSLQATELAPVNGGSLSTYGTTIINPGTTGGSFGTSVISVGTSGTSVISHR